MNDKKAFEDFNERPIVHLPCVHLLPVAELSSWCADSPDTHHGRSYRFSAGVTSDALGYDIKCVPCPSVSFPAAP